MIQFNPKSVLQSSRFAGETPVRKSGSVHLQPASDAVYFSEPSAKKPSKSLDLNWSSSLRVQASQHKDMLSMKRLSQMLPKDKQHLPRPELLADSPVKDSLGDVTQRLLMEGVDGPAKLAFEQEVERLYDRYGEDLGMDQAALRETLSKLLRKVKADISDHAIKPWSPHDQLSSGHDVSLTERLEEAVFRHRQMVMESSGDFSRVLSELTTEAKSGGDAELIRLGDFVLRISEALDVGSTNGLRAEARKELMGNSVQSIQDEALEKGRSFLEYLHGLQA